MSAPAPHSPIGSAQGGSGQAPTVLSDHEKAHTNVGLGALLAGIGAVIFSVAALLVALWLILSATVAVPFDADGVRCYSKPLQLSCIKTANP